MFKVKVKSNYDCLKKQLKKMHISLQEIENNHINLLHCSFHDYTIEKIKLTNDKLHILFKKGWDVVNNTTEKELIFNNYRLIYGFENIDSLKDFYWITHIINKVDQRYRIYIQIDGISNTYNLLIIDCDSIERVSL